jgi:ABC-type uncharacterized transport system substrate-binding protein
MKRLLQPSHLWPRIITVAAILLLATPLAADAQPAAMPVIGVLQSTSLAPNAHQVAALRRGLNESGFAEGRNVAIEFRWAEGHYDRLPALAAELVGRKVAVIVTGGGEPSALAAKAATSTIPIVFNVGGDPVKLGLVASLNRPGGNVTGVSRLTIELGPKRLELLRELVPKESAVAMLVNPNNPSSAAQVKGVQAAARGIVREIIVLTAGAEADLDAAFASLAQQRRAGALLVGTDPFFFGRRVQIAALAARHAIPTIYNVREYAEAGGLISYGINNSDMDRQVGVYAGRILKGAKPADLPVAQPTRFELVINLRTAKTLGITIPPSLQLRADQVIE